MALIDRNNTDVVHGPQWVPIVEEVCERSVHSATLTLKLFYNENLRQIDLLKKIWLRNPQMYKVEI